MKLRARCLCVMLALLMLAGCGAPQQAPTTVPETTGAVVPVTEPETAEKTQENLERIHALGESPDDNYRVYYEVFVRSYRDSDGDGVGDLQGLTEQLDYLQDLGVGGLWLMPVHPSTSYHKYNVGDYYAIDPEYGTMEDFEQFMAACQKRNIRVILDLVVNHTGSDHSWFRQACQYIKTLGPEETPDVAVCPYADYYHFLSAESCPGGYNPVPGSDCWFYESRFSPDMPDLNLASEAVRQEIRSIMEFWINKGVAGFRLDAAKEFYSGETDRNIEVLQWITDTARQLKPDVYLVAEVWDSFATIAQYYKSGIPSIFNYAFGNSNGKITKVIRGYGNESMVKTYATALQKADAAYRKNNPEYIDAPFLSNHDVGRIAGFAGRDPATTKLAGAMNLMMGGSAFIYYGEELGMVCGGSNDPSYRAPMLWSLQGGQGMTKPPEGCLLPEEYPMGSLAEQVNDDSSVYNYYRQAAAIRNALPVISHGIPTAETALNQGCVSAVKKTWQDQQCIILMNIDEVSAEVDLTDYADYTLAASLSADGNEITQEGTALHLPAFGMAVLAP